MDIFALIRKHYEYTKKFDNGVKPHDTELASVAASSLAESDRLVKYYDDEVEALRDRYSFRDGAAYTIMAVFGLDLDAARVIMQVYDAWADYVEARDKATN